MFCLTRWNPYEDLTNLDREMQLVFGRFWGENPTGHERSWVPATEVTSDKEGWKVRMAIPGIDPRDVHVNVTGSLLTIKGERPLQDEDAEKHISEIGYGSFKRSFRLSEDVNVDKVHATYDNGMLKLMLPLAEARRIEISGERAVPKQVT